METDLLFGRNEKGGCVKTLTQPFFMRKAQTFSSPGFVITQSFRIFMSHEFTRYYGISPISYLTHRRIEVCKNLLENTDHEISDIAHLAGFSSQSYLAQSFRKYCGMTAGEYRRSKKNQTI